MMSGSKSKSLIITISDSAGHTVTTDLSKLLSLGTETAFSIASALKKYASSYNSLSGAKILRILLKTLGDFFAKRPADFHNCESLYSFLFDYRSHWYTTDSISQRLDTRNACWDIFIQFTKYLMDQDIISTVTIPPSNPKLYKRDVLAKSSLHKKSSQKNKETGEYINTIIPISLARNDEDYLDELNLQFRAARDGFLKCAMEEINDMQTEMAEGEYLIQSVDYESLSEKINRSLLTSKPYHEKIRKKESRIFNGKECSYEANRYVSLFGPTHPDGHKNCLARVHYEHGGYYRFHADTKRYSTDQALKYLPWAITSAKQFGSHLGLLTCRSAIPFFVYFLIKYPRFNVESLALVEVEGKNGVTQLISTAGEESSNVRFKVTKERAKSEKSELLDIESKQVLELLLRLTEPFRTHLKKNGDPAYNKLWVCGGSTGLESPYILGIEQIRRHFGSKAYRVEDATLSKSQHGIAERSFLYFHPVLKNYVHTASLSRLRTTAGLVRWFESGGDAQAVARALGNTVRVSLDHYIPKPLQELMNKRTVRRFQNLLIVTATAGEPYFLKATDFVTLDDLHIFLSQMLQDDRSSGNELLSELQSRTGHPNYKPEDKCDVVLNARKQIVINVSAENLALLFLYEEHIDHVGTDPRAKVLQDTTTNTTPIFWAELSRLLKLAIIRGGARRELNHIYERALSRVEELRECIKFPKLITAQYNMGNV